jgi:D-alanyl-D-alanine carboxypeptidase
VRIAKIFLLVIIFYNTIAAHADNSGSLQQALQKTMDDFINTQQEHHISAAMLSVHTPANSNNITVYSGHTEYLGEKPLDSNSLFQIGGITKLFIAATLLKLEGTPELHFSLDNPLKMYFPEYPQWGDVTIRQLLNMTSGIPDYCRSPNTLFWKEFIKNPFREWKPEDIIQYAVVQPIHFRPGEGFEFSSTNYLLASLVIEKLTHHTVAEEMKKIFLATNVSLPNTYFIDNPYPYGVKDKMVHGYTGPDVFPENTDMTDFSLSLSAKGPNVSNTNDILNWMMRLFTPNDILSAQQLKELTSWVSMDNGKPLDQISSENPGYGLSVQAMLWKSHNLNRLVYFLFGTTTGYHMIVIFVPEKQIYFVVAINKNDVSSFIALDDLVENIMELLT